MILELFLEINNTFAICGELCGSCPLRLKEVIQDKARKNMESGGGDKKSGYQTFGKAVDKPIHTDKELGKLTNKRLEKFLLGSSLAFYIVF